MTGDDLAGSTMRLAADDVYTAVRRKYSDSPDGGPVGFGDLDDPGDAKDQLHDLSVLFATFQLELFDLIVRWVEFATSEIDTWPKTAGLGMTDRTEAILNSIKERRSVLEQPPQVL
jgi:hypothetical protein